MLLSGKIVEPEHHGVPLKFVLYMLTCSMKFPNILLASQKTNIGVGVAKPLALR